MSKYPTRKSERSRALHVDEYFEKSQTYNGEYKAKRC
jgi:hypothetical protein